MREKVGKSRNTMFFPMYCGSGGSKSRLAKAAGAETSGEMRNENCTPLWHEADFEVKRYKTPGSRSTFGSWDVKKVHAVVARSTFRSQNVQSTPFSDHFWKLRCRKSARRCGAKHISMSKCTKHHCRTTFGSWDVEKVHAVVPRSTCRSENVQNTTCSCHFWRFICRFAWQAQKIVHLVKSEQKWGFCSISRNDGRRGAFEEDLQRCISRGRSSTKDMFIRDVRRSGRSFPERGCILESQIFRFAEMILRDRCSTSYDLASIFRGRWNGKIAKRIGTRLSALHSTYHFWRKSRRIALFLTLLSSNIEEVSQNCCGFGRC